MRFTFKIADDWPPKKDGANSMWGKRSEHDRLVKLRRAAVDALGGRPPLTRNIHLTVTIYVGTRNDRRVGDLDTFITGVCDGLQKADARANTAAWTETESPIHPTRVVAIEDDCQVIAIHAEKRTGMDPRPWYEVILEGD